MSAEWCVPFKRPIILIIVLQNSYILNMHFFNFTPTALFVDGLRCCFDTGSDDAAVAASVSEKHCIHMNETTGESEMDDNQIG